MLLFLHVNVLSEEKVEHASVSFQEFTKVNNIAILYTAALLNMGHAQLHSGDIRFL